MQINTLPTMFPSNTRFVQAMVVADTNIPETSGDHALHVYNIPTSELKSFVQWLKQPKPDDAEESATKLHQAKQRLYKRLHSIGFTLHDKQTTLATIAEAYRTEVNSTSRIGWVRVPMIPGSIVLFWGIHRVAGGKSKRANNTYRTVLYLNPWTSTTLKQLPETVSTEVLGNPLQKNTHQGIEPSLSEYYKSLGKRYGINEETVPEDSRHLYVDSTDIPPTYRNTPTRHSLKEDGFVVLRNCLTTEQTNELHTNIVELTRDILFGNPRLGQSEAIRKKAMDMSLDTFVKTLYSDPDFRNARYFDSKTTSQWVPDDDESTPIEVREIRQRKRQNTRGVRGITNSSGMIDVYKHPSFIRVHKAIHSRLKNELGLSKLFFGPERCGLRAYLSTELPPHQDEPIVVGDACSSTSSPTVYSGETVGTSIEFGPKMKRARVEK